MSARKQKEWLEQASNCFFANFSTIKIRKTRMELNVKMWIHTITHENVRIHSKGKMNREIEFQRSEFKDMEMDENRMEKEDYDEEEEDAEGDYSL